MGHEMLNQIAQSGGRSSVEAGPILGDAPGSKFKRYNLKLKFPYVFLQHCLAMADAVLIVTASLVGSGGYQFFANGSFANVEQFLGVGVIAALLYFLIGQSASFYDLQAIFSPRRAAGGIVARWSLVSLSLSLLAFLMKIGPVFSRGSIVCFELLALLSLLVSHRAAKRFVASAVADGRVQGRRAVLVGTREELAALDGSEILRRFGLTEVHRLVFPSDQTKSVAMSDSETAALVNAVERARDYNADEIVLAIPWSDTRQLEFVRHRLRCSPLPVQLLPDRRVRSLAANPLFKLK